MEKAKVEDEVREQLFSMQDMEYHDFHCRLIPTVKPELVIGVRTPALRAFAKEFAKKEEAKKFLDVLPHQYYEENNLHGLLIETEKNFETCVKKVDEFLPYIDNWATCDFITPKVFKKHTAELLPWIQKWIRSEQTYTIRFGIEMLMKFYLDEAFETEYANLVAEIHSKEYYVNMMQGWYFATALAKQYERILPYLEQETLEVVPHNMAIRKAVESFRITKEQKIYLKTLKRPIITKKT